MKRFLALLLCLAMLASFAGCNEAPESAVTTQPTETTAPPTTQPEPTAAEVYAEAAEALRSREDVRMSVVYAREMKGQKILVICSFTEKKISFRFPKGFDAKAGQLILCNYADATGTSLKPYETRIYLWE